MILKTNAQELCHQGYSEVIRLIIFCINMSVHVPIDSGSPIDDVFKCT